MPFNLQAIGNDIVVTYVLHEEGSGKKQTFLTPGSVLGTFQIAERLRPGIGGGVQIAATLHRTITAGFGLYGCLFEDNEDSVWRRGTGR